MSLSRERLWLWLLVSTAYLLLTGWAIIYSATCEEMFCHLAMLFIGVPWTLFLVIVISPENFPLGALVILTLVCASLNVASLYVLLGEGKVIKRSDKPDKV